MSNHSDIHPPTITDVESLNKRLGQWLIRTPVVRCHSLEAHLPTQAEIYGKLEFLQQTGTFKPRGALANVLAMDDAQRVAGVTAVSAGNHAIATAFAANAVGASAKVVMLRSASQVRIDACEALGARIIFADNSHEGFKLVEEICEKEGRVLIHPFEGVDTVMGTGTVGLEICEQVENIDALIVAVGGGGLCAGISSVVKQINPNCQIIGVEPEGAASMHRSLENGQATSLEEVLTIADSLGAPFALPYSFELCRRYVDEIVLITDEAMRDAMGLLFRDMKIAVEPAGAAAAAALLGPLRSRFGSGKVMVIFCGSNIDGPTFLELAGLN